MNIKTIAGIKCRINILLLFGCVILICPLIKVDAQQIPVYSQYTFSPFVLNPAAAGAEGFTTITLTNRNQWVGIEGAPRTYSASVQARIMKLSHQRKSVSVRRRPQPLFRSGRVGIGLNVSNFHVGLINQSEAQFTFAYHIISYNGSQISMGTSLGFLEYKINTNNLKLTDMDDDPIYNNRILLFIPDANIGIYYSDHNKYLGLSILHLLQASVRFGVHEDENFNIFRQYYLIGGYKYNLNTQNVLESSFYLKSSEQLNPQLETSLRCIHDSRFWIGLGYRSGLTFIGSTGVCISKFYFGYAFDYSPKGLLNYSYGSHEVILAYKLGNNIRRYRYLDRY